MGPCCKPRTTKTHFHTKWQISKNQEKNIPNICGCCVLTLGVDITKEYSLFKWGLRECVQIP